MPLPAFTDDGDLPSGVQRATLQEVVDRFGTQTPERQAIALRLQRIHKVATATGHLERFMVFGSFVTSKLRPNDVDLFLLMADTFDVTELTGEALLLFEHAAAQAYFGASVFWLRRLAVLDDEKATIEHWQVKRDGSRRGIVEVILREP